MTRILLTGVTGYIGGRLLKLLEKGEHSVRCLVREPLRMEGRHDPRTEIVQGDLFDQPSLVRAMQGIEVAFYLVHSMGSDSDFTEQDRQAAIHFAEAASACRVKRIIYLGGLGNSQQNLSSHLKSRQEVGRYLRDHAKNVQVFEFRASIVIGSGSLSFEMIRALCERLPVMLTPQWVWTPAQPIAIKDVLAYLSQAIDKPIQGNQVFEVGGGRPRVLRRNYAGIYATTLSQTLVNPCSCLNSMAFKFVAGFDHSSLCTCGA